MSDPLLSFTGFVVTVLAAAALPVGIHILAYKLAGIAISDEGKRIRFHKSRIGLFILWFSVFLAALIVMSGCIISLRAGTGGPPYIRSQSMAMVLTLSAVLATFFSVGVHRALPDGDD